MRRGGFQVLTSAPDPAVWQPSAPATNDSALPGDALALHLGLFDAPVVTKSFRSWRDVDGAGPFLVQKRTDEAVQKNWANAHVDRWHFRIIHVKDGHGNAAARGGAAAFHFTAGGPFTGPAGHATADEALWTGAKKHVVTIADNESDIRAVWQELSIRVGAVGFELASWSRAVGHLLRGLLFSGTPSASPSLVSSRSIATETARPAQLPPRVTSSFAWSEVVPDNSSMYSGNPLRQQQSEADVTSASAAGAVDSSFPAAPRGADSLPLVPAGSSPSAHPTPLTEHASYQSGPMARCPRADRTAIALERSLLLINRHAELALPIKNNFSLQGAAMRAATAGRIAISPEGRALVWCDLHTVHTAFFNPTAQHPFGSFVHLTPRNLRAFATDAGLEPVQAAAVKPPLRTLDRGKTIYTAAKYKRHGESAPGCRIIRRAIGNAEGDHIVNLPASVDEVHDVVVSRSGETIAAVFEDSRKNWNVAVVVSEGRHGTVSDATDSACAPLHNTQAPHGDGDGDVPLLRISADGARIALAMRGGSSIVMLHLHPTSIEKRPFVARRVPSGPFRTSSAIVDFMFAPDGVTILALCGDAARAIETFVFDTSRRVDDLFNVDGINAYGLRDLENFDPLSFDITPDMRTMYVLYGAEHGDDRHVRVRCVDTQSGAVRGDLDCDEVDAYDARKCDKYSIETAGTVMLVQGPRQAQLFDLYASRTAHRTARGVGRHVTHVAYSINGAYLACIDRAKVTVLDVDMHGTATVRTSAELKPNQDANQLAIDPTGPACTYTVNSVARSLAIEHPTRELLLGHTPSSSLDLPVVANGGPYPVLPVHDVRILPRAIARPNVPLLLESAVVAGHTVVMTTYATGDTATRASDERRAGKMFHPHVIEYLGPVVGRSAEAGQSRPVTGLAFEILDGTLFHALTGWPVDGDLDLPQVLGLIAQVADAVDAMATEGYAHGGIDLDAILVLDRDRNRSGQVGNSLAGDATLLQTLKNVQLSPPPTFTPAVTPRTPARPAANTVYFQPHTAAVNVPSPVPSTAQSVTDAAATATVGTGLFAAAGAGTARLRLVAKLTNYVDPVDPAEAPDPRPLTGALADDLFIDPYRKTAKARLIPPSVAGDVYSLAVVVYASVHLLKLRETSPQDLIDRAAADGWRYVYCVGFPVELKRLVDECVTRPPAQRPTPRQFCVRLNAALFEFQQQLPSAAAAAFRLPRTPAVWGRLKMELQPPAHLLASLAFESKPEWNAEHLYVSEPVHPHSELHEHVKSCLLGTPSTRYEQAFDFDTAVIRFIECVPAAFNFERVHRRRAFALQNNTALWVQRPTADTDARGAALRRLDAAVADRQQPSGSFAPSPQSWRPPQPRIVLAWRAEEADNVAKICRDGLEPLARRDPGFFGHALYFTLEAAIAATYTAKMKKPCLMLYAISVAQPYAVTLTDYVASGGGTSVLCGAAITGGHDAHFIPVRNWGTTNPLNPEEKLPRPVYFQAATEGDPAGNTPDGHELCITSKDHCVPLLYVEPASGTAS